MKIFSYVKLFFVREIDFGKEFFFVIVFCLLFVDVEGVLVIEVSLEWCSGGFIIIEM